jgi:hypothetical protein
MDLIGQKRDPTWTPDANGVIRLKLPAVDVHARLDSQFALGFALQRRSLAFEMGDIIGYEVLELLRDKLIAALMRSPLPGYSSISVEQVLRADVLAFKLLAERTRGGIKRDGSGARPCDAELIQVLNDPDFRQALMPLPGSSRHSSASGTTPAGRSTHAAPAEAPHQRPRKTTSQKAKDKKSRGDQAPRPRGNRTEERSRPRRKSTGQSGARLPAGLIGMQSVSSASSGKKRMCFSFNLPAGCSGAKPGLECSRGWHLCMKTVNDEACSKAHSSQEHR